ncbi:MAG: CCA tRNA nucleotidyltransferase [Deltaproteobacteria bacterium]|nr:CCA tRNA nucleotidyltransferase [Deltaproteobacteria bacterium]
MLKIPKELPDSEDRVYLVGGSVRDMLMGRIPVDYDIAVFSSPRNYACKLAAAHNTRVIELGKADKSIFHVVCRDAVFDISRLKDAAIETDLEQRDFTINALAYDIRSGTIIDVTGGRQDLANKCLRMVSPSVFKQDPIRLLRAYRIAVMLGFDIENRTAAVIREYRQLIRQAAGERIRDEWFGILKCDTAAASIADMAESGLLMEIFPELTDLAGCGQNRYHQFDVLDHTLNMSGHLETHLDGLGDVYPKSGAALVKVMNSKHQTILKCAALLHDIGKPAALSLDEKGRRHYYGHEKIGARQVDKISRRYRFSNQARESVAFIVRHHLRPLFMFNQALKGRPGNRAKARFFMACGSLVPDIVLHAVADNRGKMADPDEKYATFVRFADNLLQDYFTGYRPKTELPPLISGHDLKKEFGLSPSPLFATVLKQVEAARFAGEISSRSEAIHLVGTILSNHGKT